MQRIYKTHDEKNFFNKKGDDISSASFSFLERLYTLDMQNRYQLY